MVRERIDLDVNVLGGRKIKELEASVARLSTEARKWRQISNSLVKQALVDNRKLTEQEQKQLKLNRATAEWYNLQQQSQAAILKEKKASNAETVKQLRAQEKVDKFLEKELNTTARIAEAAKAKTNAALTRAGEDLTKRGFATDAAAGRLEEQRIARESQLEIAASKKLYAYKKKREDQLWKDKLDKLEAAKKAEAKNIDMYANKAASATNRSIKAESRAVATLAKQKVSAEAKLESIKIKNIEKNSRLQIAADKKAHAAKVKREDRWFKSQLNRRAEQRGARQRGQQGALIGAGFPLLFGGGAGSVIGGGLGGLAGEKFLGKGGGFAGSIALSAIGAQIDALVGSVMELGKATTSTTGAIDYLTENELWLDENTRLLAEKMKELGQVEEAAALAGKQLGIILGQDALDALNDLGTAGGELATATNILWHQFMGLAAYMIGPLANAIAGLFGNEAKQNLLNNARKQAGGNVKDLAAIDAYEEAHSKVQKRLFTWVKDTERVFDVGFGDIQQFVMGLETTANYKPIKITQQDIKNFETKTKSGGADKSNRDAENLLRAQQIYAIEQKRLALMQTMEPMIGRAAAARDRAYAIAKAQFDTDVAISKLIAKDMPPLQKQVEIDTERVKLQQKLTVLKRQDSERLMKEAKTLREIIQYSEFDYEIATALTNEKVKQLQLQKKIAQIQNSDASDPQKQAQIDAAEKMGSITKLDQHIIKLNRDLNDTDAQIISLATSVETAFAGAMSNAITGLIDGTQTAQEAFANMFAQIGKAFIDMATQMIAKALIMKALGILGGGSSGGGFTPTGGWDMFGSVQFADGGFVSAPTQATVGEGGSNEYVIPQNKMSSSMDRWNSGMRGDSVINGAEPTETAGGMVGADQPSAINIAGGVLQFNDTNYIKQDQIPAIVNQASKAGEAKALRRLQMSPATRQKLGI